MKRYISTLLFLLLIFNSIYSQKQSIYQNYINKLKVTWDLQFNDPDSALILLNKYEKYLIKNAKKIDSINYLFSDLYNNKGVAYYLKDDYPSAIKAYEKAYNYRIMIGDSAEISMCFNNLAVAYQYMGKQKEAIEYHYKSLNIRDAMKDKNGMVMSLNNIGLLYLNQQMYSDAKKVFMQAYHLIDTNCDNYTRSAIYNNLGNVYGELGDYKNAVSFFKKTYALDSLSGNMKEQVTSLGNLGKIYNEKGDDDLAKKYLIESVNIADKINIPKAKITAYKNYSQFLFKNEKFSEAKDFAFKAYILSNEIKDIRSQRILSEMLSILANKLNQPTEAYKYLKEFVVLKDSMLSLDKKEELLKKSMQYDYDQQKLRDSLAHQKEEEIHQVENEKNKAELKVKRNQQYALFGGIILLALFAIFMFNRFKVTRRQKLIIEEAHLELEEKNKEILDSIHYAKRIQAAVLPASKTFKELLPNSFILYKPKDIVAGDFYWLEKKDNRILLAACDCTGHGVPGAMVSVVCVNGLNRSVREYGYTLPGEILNKTREIVIEEFEKSEDDVKDGMDISLASLSPNKIHWAGANNPLWLIRNNELMEYKADKQPIGKYINPTPFETHQIDLQKGDTIYIFTDGYQDQFGGERGKKLKAKAFKELLLSIQEKSMEEQKNIIDNTFETWKGNLEQNDDVCVIGVRI